MNRPRLLAALAAALLLLAGAARAEELLFEKVSPFTTVLVTREGPYRILRFRGADGDVEQSRCDERQPDHLYHEYSRMQLLGLLYGPPPDKVLVVGLGGASLPKALAAAVPGVQVDSVEIDPVVAEAARRFFFYREGPRVRTFVEDARTFATHAEGGYDLVFLDAFAGDEIPYPLRTREFYQQVRGLLAPGGRVVANLMRRSELYLRDRATFASVFPAVGAWQGLGNVVLVGADRLGGPPEERVAEMTAWFRGEYPLAGYLAHPDEEEAAPALPLTDASPP